MSIRFIYLIILCFAFSACGVKGVPLAPIKPAAIGDGKTAYSKERATKRTQIKNKYNYKLEKEDSEEASEED